MSAQQGHYEQPNDDEREGACLPDCRPDDLVQTASDEAQCTVCGLRRPMGDDW